MILIVNNSKTVANKGREKTLQHKIHSLSITLWCGNFVMCDSFFRHQNQSEHAYPSNFAKFWQILINFCSTFTRFSGSLIFPSNKFPHTPSRSPYITFFQNVKYWRPKWGGGREQNQNVGVLLPHIEWIFNWECHSESPSDLCDLSIICSNYASMITPHPPPGTTHIRFPRTCTATAISLSLHPSFIIVLLLLNYFATKNLKPSEY